MTTGRINQVYASPLGRDKELSMRGLLDAVERNQRLFTSSAILNEHPRCNCELTTWHSKNRHLECGTSHFKMLWPRLSHAKHACAFDWACQSSTRIHNNRDMHTNCATNISCMPQCQPALHVRRSTLHTRDIYQRSLHETNETFNQTLNETCR